MFDDQFVEDLSFWERNDRAVAKKVKHLVREILATPFTGRGKPEALKYQLQGAWSRRLTKEHRIVYVVFADRIEFLQCRYHY